MRTFSRPARGNRSMGYLTVGRTRCDTLRRARNSIMMQSVADPSQCPMGISISNSPHFARRGEGSLEGLLRPAKWRDDGQCFATASSAGRRRFSLPRWSGLNRAVGGIVSLSHSAFVWLHNCRCATTPTGLAPLPSALSLMLLNTNHTMISTNAASKGCASTQGAAWPGPCC